MVRSASWRAITSSIAAVKASTSSGPLIRNAVGMLWVATAPSKRSRNHNRLCANDNGTNAGRALATNGFRPPPLPPTRGANCATVGDSKTVRTAT
ncbi:hypothetical protein MTIM_52820 [Mycobacterium timonense]|uniref:Uncharacterized protein n=1 Tax=Mycobacterium timonense TaxID=701043 RepID=A0A7I9ZES8_9MYCO|nr:hypothetical protein MTIM_52820 [Mycobacterium timonense]